MTQRTNYVLIDYENVQPTDLSLLREGPFKVKIFLGAHQAKIPVSLASTLQDFGSNAEYVVLECSGRNALDFHIAYYVGLLSAQDSVAFFHVISGDEGYDPLLQHLKSRGVLAQRSTSIASIPFFKPALPATIDAQVDVVVERLTRMKASRPRTTKTLMSTLHALFRKELSQQQVSTLFGLLCKRGIVRVEGTRVSYELPAGD